MPIRFLNRSDAGRQLAERLRGYAGRQGVLVLALPRGGVPVGYEVAQALGAELDVLIVRKLAAPPRPEVAIGAIASGGARYLLPHVVREGSVEPSVVRAVEATERAEVQRRERAYRGSRPPLRVHGRTVIVVDDGIATGATMHVAALALRDLQPARIVAAVPVAPVAAGERLGAAVDEFVCVSSPIRFDAISDFYERFAQVSDEEIRDLLRQSREMRS